MCIPSGSQKARREGFGIRVEGGVKALETMVICLMGVPLVRKPLAQRVFTTLLTDSVQQLLKLHRMMDIHFLRYQTVLGTSCEEVNWILIGKFAEDLFSGTWRESMIGEDAFYRDGSHTMCSLPLGSASNSKSIAVIH
jgi:hypothetical protein